MDYIITSLQNPKIKETVKLRERKQRDETQRFLIEGYRELMRAQQKNHPIDRLFYCPDFFLGDNEEALIQSIDAEKILCEKHVFQKLSYRDRPDGLLAVAPMRPWQLKNLKLSSCPFILVAESIEKPGNLGTMLRTSDGAGVDAVLLTDPVTDLFNPNVIRASVGTFFSVPVVSVSNQEALDFLKEKNIQTVAATPQAKELFTEANFKIPLAIIVGSEQYGLSDFWMNRSEVQVRIPMHGIADSLNVSTAACLLLYEVIRQRSHCISR